MISNIGYTPVFGFPAVLWLGLAAGLCFLCAATIQFLNFYTRIKVPVKWHVRFAVAGFVIMIIHAALAIAIYI